MSHSAAPPTILFMGRIFEVPWGGVRELAEGLLRAAMPLCERDGRRVEVLVPRRGICPVKSPALREVVLPRFAGNRILWDHGTVANYANTKRNAVLYNIKLVLPERLTIPGFTTIHDLMYFAQPQKYNWREYLLADTLYMRLGIRRTVHRAPFTQVDSQATAADARELFPDVSPDRFVTIHCGIDPAQWSQRGENEAEILAQIGVKKPYVFHSGGLSRRKNVGVLARAFTKFHSRHVDYQLVLTGGDKPTTADPTLRRSLNAIPRRAVLRTGHVSREILGALYRNAEFFVFPSLYEGFGFPPLEAQAAGCPVICSHATSLPEVVGDSALLFDPRSPSQLLDHMEFLAKPSNRTDLIARGRDNARKFPWENAARQWLRLADRVFSTR